MKLRTMLATVALGASVLTAVPATVAPDIASADGYCDQYSQCYQDWDLDVTIGTEYMQQVIVTGSYQWPSAVWDPNWSNYTGGGGGTPNDPPAQKIEEGGKEEIPQDCIKNNSPNVVKRTTTATYNVTYQVSANISASAKGILAASLGVTFGATVTRSASIEVTINPGQSWALYVEYQTNLYKILGPNGLEYASVTAPTGTVVGRAC